LPHCSGQKICTCQALAALHPDWMRGGNWDENMHLDLNSVGFTSRLSASWVCPEHGSWSTYVSFKAIGTQCPDCARDARIGRPRPQRGLLKDKYPNIFGQLHPTLNGDCKVLGSITSGSGKKLYWLCTGKSNRPLGCRHMHAWKATVANRCLSKAVGAGCPFCAGRVVYPCNSLEYKQPKVLQYWH